MKSLKSVPEEFFGKGLEKLFDISSFTAMTYEEQMEPVNLNTPANFYT